MIDVLIKHDSLEEKLDKRFMLEIGDIQFNNL